MTEEGRKKKDGKSYKLSNNFREKKLLFFSHGLLTGPIQSFGTIREEIREEE